MARIRTVKPEFWTNEQVMECSPLARLLFIGMWNFCDDFGNHPASLKTIKAEVFPSDDIDSTTIRLLIVELSTNDLLVEYESSGKAYWHVTGWKHQKIDRPTAKYPQIQQVAEVDGKFDDHSTTIRRPFDDHSTTDVEGKGCRRDVEGNGVTPPSQEEPIHPQLINTETGEVLDVDGFALAGEAGTWK